MQECPSLIIQHEDVFVKRIADLLGGSLCYCRYSSTSMLLYKTVASSSSIYDVKQYCWFLDYILLHTVHVGMYSTTE